MPRPILITGATGGLGLSLVEAARAAGYDVLATGRSATAVERLTATGARFTRADLTDAAALPALVKGQASVIHAAALSASWGRRADFEQVNVGATRMLIEAARESGCSRFVFVSSPSIYAGFRDRLNIKGSDAPPRRQLSDYSRSKLRAEELVRGADGPAMRTCAVRPRAIVGPDDKVLLPALLAMAMRKRVLLPGGGAALIELTDVRDAARAILLAEEAIPVIGGRAINISGGSARSVSDIARGLAAALGLSPRFVALPMIAGRAGALLAEAWASASGSAREPVLTRYALATLGFTQTFDAEEPARLIGYRPRHDAFATLLAQARRCRR
jgi:nucleoside-diphosphate-sugar epimerase